MSYQIGIDTIHLRPTPRLAHTDYCDHAPFMRQVEAQTGKRFSEAWQFDFLWYTHDGPVPWESRGRATNMGHAEYVEGGADFKPDTPSPFTDAEQVLAFDAVSEYGLADFDALVKFYEDDFQRRRRANPHTVNMGGYYRSIVSGAIAAFGWDMLLTAAAEPDRFERVLDSFFRLTLHHVKAWAATSIEVFMQHDDFVWTSGPFMSPAFYRSAIIPRYAALWRTLHDAGKKVLFTADGDYTEFLDDVTGAGADGLVFEPCMSLDTIVGKFGKTHAIIGSKVDCRTMTFGTIDDIRREMDATFELAFDCPGFFFAVGNHLPVNIPAEHLRFYYDYLTANWNR